MRSGCLCISQSQNSGKGKFKMIKRLFSAFLSFIKRHKLLAGTFTIFLLSLLLNMLAGSVISPKVVEKVYSDFIFKNANIVWSSMTGVLPFSLGEILILAAIPAFFILLA